MEFDFAGLGAQRNKLPAANQLLEWAIHQAHQNALVAGQCIACGEGLTDAGFGHINRRRHLRRPEFQHAATGAAWQKIRIGLHIVYQLIHLFRAERHKRSTANLRHSRFHI